jgi:pterin-4a-carbinolamine dehydratase
MIKTKKNSYLGLKNWELKDEKIVKNFQFTSFKEVINFVNKVAEI